MSQSPRWSSAERLSGLHVRLDLIGDVAQNLRQRFGVSEVELGREAFASVTAKDDDDDALGMGLLAHPRRLLIVFSRADAHGSDSPSLSCTSMKWLQPIDRRSMSWWTI